MSVCLRYILVITILYLYVPVCEHIRTVAVVVHTGIYATDTMARIYWHTVSYFKETVQPKRGVKGTNRVVLNLHTIASVFKIHSMDTLLLLI